MINPINIIIPIAFGLVGWIVYTLYSIQKDIELLMEYLEKEKEK